MSTSVAQLAAETGLTVDQVLEACRRAGVSAWGPTTILLEGDLRLLQPHLGASAPAAAPPSPPSPSGPLLPPPGQAPMPPPGAMPPPFPGAMPPPYAGSMPPPGAMPPPGFAYAGGPPPVAPKRSRTRAALIAVAFVVLAIIGLAALGSIEDPETGESVLDVPDIFGSQFPDLAVGDCFDSNSDVPLVTGTSLFEAVVEEVDCSGPHDAEVFRVFTHPAPPDTVYPGDGPMSETAFGACVEQFDGFVGAPYATSALDIYFLAPNADAFSRFDERTILCAVVNVDGSPLPGGTQRDSGR